MNRTEEEVWKFTPRKLQALLNVHFDLISKKYSQKTDDIAEGFIDTIPGW